MKAIPSESTGSISKGLWFICKDGNNTLKAWGSCFNGKERVYLNDQLVSETQSIISCKEHTFKDNDDLYKVSLTVDRKSKALVECRFYRNNELLKTLKSEFVKGRILTWKKLSVIILVSVFYGAAAGLFKFPTAYFYFFLVLVIFCFLLTTSLHVKISEIA